jgi:hypothetical protein
MANPTNEQNAGQTPTIPTDKGEDSEERREAAEQAWRDKQGIPRGTPEQDERSADRVGGGGPAQPEPEIEDDANESTTKRAPDADDAQADKRRASTDYETDSD